MLYMTNFISGLRMPTESMHRTMPVSSHSLANVFLDYPEYSLVILPATYQVGAGRYPPVNVSYMPVCHIESYYRAGHTGTMLYRHFTGCGRKKANWLISYRSR